MVIYNPQTSNPIIIYHNKRYIFVYLPTIFSNTLVYQWNNASIVPLEFYRGPYQDRIIYFDKLNWTINPSNTLTIGDLNLTVVEYENSFFIKDIDHEIDLSFNQIKVPVFGSYFLNNSVYQNQTFIYLRNYNTSIFDKYLFAETNLQTPFSLKGISFVNCDFSNTIFDNSVIYDCSFVKCTFLNCQFKNVDISGSHFLRSYLQNTDWTDSNLRSTSFVICNLDKMIFPKTIDQIGSAANFGKIKTSTWVLSSGVLSGPANASINLLTSVYIPEITQTEQDVKAVLLDLDFGWYILNQYLYYDMNYKLNLNYLGKAIEKISETQTFELGQNFYLDRDNLIDFSGSNITLSSPLFYSRVSGKNQFYYLSHDQIFDLDLSLNSTRLLISQEGDRIQRYVDGNYQLFKIGGKQYDLSENFAERDFSNNIVLDDNLIPKISTQNTEIINSIYYPTTYLDKIYTILDSQTILKKENNQLTILNPNNPDLTLNYSSSIIHDYQKSTYFFDSSNNFKKLDMDGNLTTIDVSTNRYLTLTIDSDESIQISVDPTTKLFFSNFIYNEILFAEKTLRFSDFYVFDKKDCFSTFSLDGNQMLFIDFTTKLLYLFIRNIENEFELQTSFSPDMNIRNFLNLDDKINTIRVDWRNRWIYFGLGGMNPNSKGKVIICSWNPSQSEYRLVQVLSSVLDPSGYSFGSSIDVSIYGDIIAIGEPNATPKQNYKRGRINIYQKQGESLIWTNELRSEDSSIGFIVKLSPTENELATFGTTTNPNETMKLVLFRSILLPTARSISLPYQVDDFEFFGKEVLMTANEIVENSSIFHWIQKVNRCFEIVTTRDLTHESIVKKLSDRFDIYSIKNEYLLMVRKKLDLSNEYQESSIELYHVEDDLEQLAVIDLENKKIKLYGNISSSYDGSTMGYQSYQDGKFDFYFYF